MTERGILMTPANYAAILDNRKVQTRRIIEPQPVGEPRPLIEWSRGIAKTCGDICPDPEDLAAHAARLHGKIFPFTTKHGGLMSPKCPFGTVGDRLYVKEGLEKAQGQWIQYRRDKTLLHRSTLRDTPRIWEWKQCYLSPIHMPKWAARLWLELTEVRVERLQEMGVGDAFAEGIDPRDYHEESDIGPLDGFQSLWESIHGPGSWDLNPWVWCLAFRKVPA